MFVIRDIMHCKPGSVRPMVQKFQKVNEIMKGMGLPTFRILTDVSGAPFWTLSAEIEVESLDGFAELQQKVMSDPKAQAAMAGYHDLVSSGAREIYKLEG